MASSKEYLDYVLDLLSGTEEISYRPMMGEYLIYFRDKVVGGIYDNRFLLKPTKTALQMMPDAKFEIPYDGAKEMLLVDDRNEMNRQEFRYALFSGMYQELPAPKKKK